MCDTLFTIWVCPPCSQSMVVNMKKPLLTDYYPGWTTFSPWCWMVLSVQGRDIDKSIHTRGTHISLARNFSPEHLSHYYYLTVQPVILSCILLCSVQFSLFSSIKSLLDSFFFYSIHNEILQKLSPLQWQNWCCDVCDPTKLFSTVITRRRDFHWSGKQKQNLDNLDTLQRWQIKIWSSKPNCIMGDFCAHF